VDGRMGGPKGANGGWGETRGGSVTIQGWGVGSWWVGWEFVLLFGSCYQRMLKHMIL
jgi:hypothetical protein